MARAGHAAALAAHLDSGVSPNLTNPAGDTLLMLAAYYGRPEAVKTLIERGADVNLVSERGQTPLAGAVFHGDAQVVRLLLDAGADPAAGSPTAIETARTFGLDDYLDLLEGRP